MVYNLQDGGTVRDLDRQKCIYISNKRHVWTKEENEYFMQACLKLAEESSFFRGQTDKYAAFKSYWKKSRQLRYELGSTFDPKTGLFNNSEEWWSLKIAIDEKVQKFRNGIPHAKELDIIFKNQEDFPMSSISCNRSCSFGCQPSVSQMISVQQAPIPSLESTMGELSDAGLNRTDDVMITTLIHLKDSEVRKWYSQTPSIDDNITILKKLHKQVRASQPFLRPTLLLGRMQCNWGFLRIQG